MKRVFQEFITDAGRYFLRRHYEKNTKDLLLKYMKNRGELCVAGGFVDDVVTGKTVRIEDGGYRDDQFEWSDQDTYHIEKYDAAVTDEFLDHVLKKWQVKEAM